MTVALSSRRGWKRGPLLLAALFLSPLAAFAQAPAAPEKVKLCETCHGPGGNSTTPMIPSIAGQPVPFLENQLVYFREQLRHAPVMQGIAQGMKDEEIVALARHFAAQKAAVVEKTPADGALAARAAAIAGERHCGQCHLERFQGREQMPRLAGQREDYLFDTMKAQRDGTRTGADTTMTEVLGGLSDADLKALAHHLARTH